MRPNIDLTTCVWGAWHLRAWERAMVPTLLSERNLPLLARRTDVRYRVASTRSGVARIAATPSYARLKELCPVELVVVSEAEAPPTQLHVDWYHRAVEDARSAGSFCLFAPPDVAWSDGTFAEVAASIEAGRAAAAMPYLRVVSETCLTELEARAEPGGPLRLPPGELVRLGVRHLHPLSAAALAGGRHGRPSLEMFWRVPGEGLVMRHAVRELFFFDPRRVQVSHLWYALDGCAAGELDVVDDSDRMMMLSLAPLMKDLPLYIPERGVTPMDVARQTLHPLNDTPFTSLFAGRSIRLHYGEMTPARWRRAERRSEIAFKQVLVLRDLLRVWAALEGHPCRTARRALAVAAQATSLARRWPHAGPVTAFVPTDEALQERAGDWMERLLAVGAERQLQEWVLAHVASGRGDGLPSMAPIHTKIVECFDVPPHRVSLVDQTWAVPGLPLQSE
jgi:hypothetical protein